MDFDLGRSPTAALTALRYVEDIALRVRFALFGARVSTDPVTHLIRTHRRIHRRGDARLLRHAYDVAERMHEGQLRKSGEPYITHPLAVAQILAELGMDTTTIVAALLHDTVEDTDYTMNQLNADFGGEVGLLVDGVTKFEKAFYGHAAEAETIRKMIIAAGVDVRVLVVKLADRLHNMQTIDARSIASRVRIARATMDVLIPLCDRLGIQVLKSRLEDTVLAAIEPEIHAELRSWVAHRPEWTAIVDDVVRRSSAVLQDHKIRAQVIARPHHLYSIYKDTYGKGHPAAHELPRIAIIVAGEENDCYTALGAIHSVWRPVAGRFKDFIASPKNNLYRSLHTTVIGPDDRAVEVLIRTEAMHRNSEYGIVAAFRFARKGPGAHSARGRHRDDAGHAGHADSTGSAGRAASADGAARAARAGSAGHSEEHLDWLRRVVEWQREAVDPVRFIESLRCDLAEGQVHVFVGGDRLLLPENSTPVDVAYALGPEIGDRCMAATVNGQLVFLNSPLADGDVVEIHAAGATETRDADGNPIGPSRDWLTFVRTPHAQLHIERRLGARAREDPNDDGLPLLFPARVKIGRTAIGLELRRRERRLTSEMPLLELAAGLGFPDVENLYAAVADRTIDAEEVVQRLIDQVDRRPQVAGQVATQVAARVATTASPRP